MTKDEHRRFMESHVGTLTAFVRSQGFSVHSPGFWVEPSPEELPNWSMFGIMESTGDAVLLGFSFVDADKGVAVVRAATEGLFQEKDDLDLT